MLKYQFTTYTTSILDRRSPRWLVRLYRQPDAYLYEGDALQYRHLDLPYLGDAELGRQARNLRRRLDLEARPSPWLIQREAAIRAELAERQQPAAKAPTEPLSRSPKSTSALGQRGDLSRPSHSPSRSRR